MAREDFPLCIHCDSSSTWFISCEGNQVVYNCGSCGNTVVVEVVDA
jgi:predicted RNA-binding Zn-ribbon protein involved in translation (DUF1610 family)